MILLIYIYLYNILGVCLSGGGGVVLLGGKGVRVSTFCIIRIVSSRRLQMYHVMDATDRMAQWRACSSRSRLGPSKTKEQWWIADEVD